ncbi:MAG: MATE family efflux transporter [Alloprevotella sp.]
MNKEILHIALPGIAANATIPLLGLCDTAIAGHLGGAEVLGAIAVGGMMFNLMYWLLGFLRMATGGLTAQAHGRADGGAVYGTLLRSVLTGGLLSLLLLAGQQPLKGLALAWMAPSAAVVAGTETYYGILIWGAPAVLLSYSLTGWFLGRQNARPPMYVAIVQNLVNIALSLTLVCGLKMGIVGVAVGTLASQYVAAVLAVALGLAVYRKEAAAVVPAGRRRHFMKQQLAGNREQRQATRRFLATGRDIFLRTICLVAVTTQFTAAGAALSDTALAANALLMQFFIVFSYIMDGFAYAAEAIGGKLYGAGDTIAFRRLIRCLTGWGAGLAAAFTLIYATSGSLFIRLLTDIPEVVTAATALLPFVVAIPVAGVAAFLFDGLFIGTTSTREMLVAILVSAIAFFALLEGLPASWQAAGLWTAFLCYLILRGTVSALLCPGVLRRMQQNKA